MPFPYHSFSLHQSRPFVVLSPPTLIILLSLLLSGDIQLNPGPVSNNFNVCTLNTRSLLNPMKFTAIFDLAQSRNVDLFALTETWITLLPHLLNYAMQPLPVSLSLAVLVQHLLI